MIRTSKAEITAIRQRTQFTCMAASMSMALGAFDIKATEDEVNRILGASPMRGASWEDALAAAQYFGCRGTLVAPCTIELLKTFVDAKNPVLIGWNPNGRPWSHASLVFDVDTEKELVYVADPNLPDPNQKVVEVPFEDFFRKWSEDRGDYLVRRPAMVLTREIGEDGEPLPLNLYGNGLVDIGLSKGTKKASKDEDENVNPYLLRSLPDYNSTREGERKMVGLLSLEKFASLLDEAGKTAKFPKGVSMSVDEVSEVVGPEFKEMNENPPPEVVKVREEMEKKAYGMTLSEFTKAMRSASVVTASNTNFWEITEPFRVSEWSQIVREARIILAEAENQGLVICGPLGEDEPEVEAGYISLNGDKSEGEDHETFDFGNEVGKSFCDTKGKPYDEVVKSILSAAVAVNPEKILLGRPGAPSNYRRTLASTPQKGNSDRTASDYTYLVSMQESGIRVDSVFDPPHARMIVQSFYPHVQVKEMEGSRAKSHVRIGNDILSWESVFNRLSEEKPDKVKIVRQSPIGTTWKVRARTGSIYEDGGWVKARMTQEDWEAMMARDPEAWAKVLEDRASRTAGSASGKFGFPKATENLCTAGVARLQKAASRIAKALYAKDENSVPFLMKHSQKSASKTASLLLKAMEGIGPSAMMAKSASKWRMSTGPTAVKEVAKALKGVKGVSDVTEGTEHVIFIYDGDMYDLSKEDLPKSVKPYVDAKSVKKLAGRSGMGMYGFFEKTAKLAITACNDLHYEAGVIASDLFARKGLDATKVAGYLTANATKGKCAYCALLAEVSPEVTTAPQSKRASSTYSTDYIGGGTYSIDAPMAWLEKLKSAFPRYFNKAKIMVNKNGGNPTMFSKSEKAVRDAEKWLLDQGLTRESGDPHYAADFMAEKKQDKEDTSQED